MDPVICDNVMNFATSRSIPSANFTPGFASTLNQTKPVVKTIERGQITPGSQVPKRLGMSLGLKK